MTNQPNLNNQIPCPRCNATGRLLSGHRCPVCNGFKLIGEVGMRRYKLSEALREKKERQMKEGTYIPPNFDEPCYF